MKTPFVARLWIGLGQNTEKKHFLVGIKHPFWQGFGYNKGKNIVKHPFW